MENKKIGHYDQVTFKYMFRKVVYSQTCVERPPKENKKIGRYYQVTFVDRFRNTVYSQTCV